MSDAPGNPGPPRTLRQPPDAGPPLPPVRRGPEVTALHAEWARVHQGPTRPAADRPAPPSPSPGPPLGPGAEPTTRPGPAVQGRTEAAQVLHRGLETFARRARQLLAARRPNPGDQGLGVAQRDDRALLGAAIRALDALAQRADELAQRLQRLEEVVEELTLVTSEELTALRANQAGPADRASPGPAPGGGG